MPGRGYACEQAQDTREPVSSGGFGETGLRPVSESGINRGGVSGDPFQNPPAQSRKDGPALDKHQAQGSLPETPKQRPKFCCMIGRVQNSPDLNQSWASVSFSFPHSSAGTEGGS